MKAIRYGIIALGVTLSIFTANSLWYAVIMSDFYDGSSGHWSQVSRDDPSIPIVLLGILVLAVLMTAHYPFLRLPIRHPILADGAFGVLIGLIYVLPSSLYYYGTTDFLEFVPMAMDVLWHMIEEGLAGVVLGMLYRRLIGQPASAPAADSQVSATVR